MHWASSHILYAHDSVGNSDGAAPFQVLRGISESGEFSPWVRTINGRFGGIILRGDWNIFAGSGDSLLRPFDVFNSLVYWSIIT